MKKMETICGIDCTECSAKDMCGGCVATDGHPFGGECVCARCYKKGGEAHFNTLKNHLIDEINSLGIDKMPAVTALFQLAGSYVNLEYTLLNGTTVKLLDDKKIYLGCQVEKADSDRCYGIVADEEYLLVCEYGCNGSNPQIIEYRRISENLKKYF